MAETEEKSDDNYFLCLLCFKPYDSPRELPCLHSFCRRCLDSFTKSESTATDTTFPCPVCETPTPHNSPRSPVNTWSSFLPLGVPHPPSPGASGGDNGIACEGCRRDGEDTRATYWCRHCVEALCSPCRIAHRRNKKTSDHKVVEVSDISKTGGPQPLTLPVHEGCTQHTNKTLEVYCLDHHSLCCILCLAVSHRECRHMRSIEDISRKPIATCDDIWVKLDTESKMLVHTNDASLAAIELDKESVTASIKSKLDSIRKKIDELQSKLLDDVILAHNKNQEHLLSHKQNTEQFYTNVRNTRLLMATLSGHVTPRQAFIAREQANVQLTRHYQRLKHRTLQSDNLYRLEIQMDDAVDEIMNTLTAVGSVQVTSTLSDTTKHALAAAGTTLESMHKTQTLSSFSDSMSSSDMIGSLTRSKLKTKNVEPKPEMKTVKPHLMKSVLSKDLVGRQVILLTGGTFVDENKLIMADCNNKRLLMFDENYNYIKQYAINGCPTDVARGNKSNELYVSVYNKEILRCSLASGHLDVIGKTECPTLTCGVALLDEKLLVVTSDTIKVLEADGQEVNSVLITTTGTTCIAACSQRHMYFHRDNNSVVGRTLDG
ncbi:RING finger protein 207-like, partial [Mizuhopecten yessoensis]|uniref:RING finger protein 207-like n=1 Tax=Mizuhopecten yessoensis TaxID=6573 RepID=UPI000B458B6D